MGKVGLARPINKTPSYTKKILLLHRFKNKKLSLYKNIKISNFNYELTENQIAKYPLKNRDKSKLLIWQKGILKENIFENCADFLPANSQLVFNNTRVIHARLYFKKNTGAKIEIFCLEPIKPADYQVAFQTTQKVIWKCLVGNSKKWKSGILTSTISIKKEKIKLQAEKKRQLQNSFEIEFTWNKPVTFSEIIEYAGELPIPPYLNRDTEKSDEESYQTVYAKIDGSVAAPTAGLHFTEKVFASLSEKKIASHEITLHVGAGTFQPVKSETIDGHTMHHEMVIIQKSIIEKLLQSPLNIIAVGTTSVRSLESLYWIGLQLEKGRFNSNSPEIKQWEPYENKAEISTSRALQNVINFLNNQKLNQIQFATQIIILPGYNFKIINGMFTNFHQPQSTLLLLISAFLGESWKEVYNYALKNNFRFLSYGDSNLYLKN